MADHRPLPHFPPHRPSSPDFARASDVDEKFDAITSHLSTIEGMQRADHSVLTSLNESVGSSPDAATGAEGKGMRKQLADVSAKMNEMCREWAEMKSRGEGVGSVVVPGKASTAGTVGAVVAGFMATAAMVLKVLESLGVLK